LDDTADFGKLDDAADFGNLVDLVVPSLGSTAGFASTVDLAGVAALPDADSDCLDIAGITFRAKNKGIKSKPRHSLDEIILL
jgi:hypothetical protein